jgi:hypothetical protein
MSHEDQGSCVYEHAAEIEQLKYDLGIAHRVCGRAEEDMKKAVRIGCENITSREKAEAELGVIRGVLDMERAHLKIVESQLAELRGVARGMAKAIDVFFHHWKHGGIARDNQFHGQTAYVLNAALLAYRKLGDSPTVGVAEKKEGA